MAPASKKGNGEAQASSKIFQRNLLHLRTEQLLDRLKVDADGTVETTLRNIYGHIKGAPEAVGGDNGKEGTCTKNGKKGAAVHPALSLSAKDAVARAGHTELRLFNYSPASSPSSAVFVPPTRIEVVGSFLLKTMTTRTVDLAVYMPDSMFQAKDHVNYKYADKRTAYTAVLSEHLRQKGFKCDVEFIDGNAFRPALVYNVARNAGEEDGDGADVSSWKIRILVCLSGEQGSAITETKLQLWKNALRRGTGKDGSNIQEEEEQQELPASPFYNAAILEDLYASRVLQLQHQAMERQEALRPAILLLKRWAACRFLEASLNCPLSLLACYVAGTTPSARDPMQLFKATLNFVVRGYGHLFDSTAVADSVSAITKYHFEGSGGCLQQIYSKTNNGAKSKASSSLDGENNDEEEEPVTSSTTTSTSKATIKETETEKGMRSVHVEPLNLFVGELNVFQKFAAATLEELAWEAKLTLKILDTEHQGVFDQVFGSFQHPDLHWDQAVEIDLSTKGVEQAAFCSLWSDGKGPRPSSYFDQVEMRDEEQEDHLAACYNNMKTPTITTLSNKKLNKKRKQAAQVAEEEKRAAKKQRMNDASVSSCSSAMKFSQHASSSYFRIVEKDSPATDAPWSVVA
ncbi:unnamed protein product, partial [Amoebophrya sp. A25]|eukprot:GSA25T00002990001.1